LVSILQSWLKNEFEPQQVLYVAIDRTKWGCINLLMISLIWNRRALQYIGNFYPNRAIVTLRVKQQLSPKLSDYSRITKLFFRDREFCSVKLGSWVATERAYFCFLRLKKNEFVQLEGEIWLQLEQLGLVPGMQLYLDGVSVTKQKDLVSSMLRASGNVNIRDGPQTGGLL